MSPNYFIGLPKIEFSSAAIRSVPDTNRDKPHSQVLPATTKNKEEESLVPFAHDATEQMSRIYQ